VLRARVPLRQVLWAVAALVGTEPVIADSAARAVDSSTLQVNGVPLATRVLTVRGAPDAVAAALLARWRTDPSVVWVHAQALGSRIVVGRRAGPFAVGATVHAAPTRGYSRVVIGVTDARLPLRSPPSLGTVRPPAGLQWLSASESPPELAPRDEPAAQPILRSTEFLGVMDVPPELSRLRWIASLRRAGFVLQQPAAQQIEAHRDGESLWLGFQSLGSRTGVVLQRRWHVVAPR
jgi:hypothetical protein